MLNSHALSIPEKTFRHMYSLDREAFSCDAPESRLPFQHYSTEDRKMGVCKSFKKSVKYKEKLHSVGISILH
jgi:hypothetical protein